MKEKDGVNRAHTAVARFICVCLQKPQNNGASSSKEQSLLLSLDTQLLLLEVSEATADLPRCLEVVVIIYHETLMTGLPELFISFM